MSTLVVETLTDTLKFEQDAITIYDELNEEEFGQLYELSQRRTMPLAVEEEVAQRRTLRREDGSERLGRVPESALSKETVMMRERESAARKAIEEKAKKEMVEKEMVEKKTAEKEMAEKKKAEMEKADVTSFDPFEDVVESLLKQWTIPSISSTGTLSPESPAYKTTEHKLGTKVDKKSPSPNRARKCMHRFQEGEWMYSCYTCGKEDNVVFCADCIHSSDHAGHDVSKRKSKTKGNDCDCGHSDSVNRPVRCSIHGTYDSWGPV